jgi:hypothetical protein
MRWKKEVDERRELRGYQRVGFSGRRIELGREEGFEGQECHS